jgi:hypothetical protein
MSQRLHNSRPSQNFDFEVAGLRYTATVSRFPDGRVGEIFLANHKPGSQSDSKARDAGVAASLTLQLGCPLDVLRRDLLRDAHGSASTPLGAAIEVGLLAPPSSEPEPKSEPRARRRWNWRASFVKNILARWRGERR